VTAEVGSEGSRVRTPPHGLPVRGAPGIGTVVGKYRLDRVLGTGGMAVVFAATHRSRKTFAIKMLRRELSADAEIRRRFLREGRAANSIEHTGVVRVLEHDVTEDGTPFLVMELLEGAEVDRICETAGETLPVRAVLALGHELLDVLAAAHASGVVHRDIKPGNLFVTSDGSLKLLDFGIARVRGALAIGRHATKTGAFMGTPAFMSPEQAIGDAAEVDARTDLWSAGATLFKCLTGKLVHEARSESHQMILSATVPARRIVTVAPGVPRSVAQIVDRALAFEKGARWASARAMRDALAAAYRALFGAPISREPLLPLVRGVAARPRPHVTRPVGGR
jgi:serine/threonine-protein kinase